MTKTYLLIDCGYLFFYRYYATKLWYKRAHEYTDDLIMVKDIHFQNTFQRMIRECIQKLVKRFETCWTHVIFCRDCSRSTIWRNKNYVQYKANRDTTSLTGLPIASRLLKETIFEIVRQEGAKSIGVATTEADDIVFCAINFVKTMEPSSKYVIIASDHDYYQILDKVTSLVGLDKRDHMLSSTRVTHQLEPTKAAKIDLLVKIISGDSSDNIKPIFPRCGPKTALKLALEPELLASWFKKYPVSETRFKENQQLIDMSEIPEMLQIAINNKLRVCLGYR